MKQKLKRFSALALMLVLTILLLTGCATEEVDLSSLEQVNDLIEDENTDFAKYTHTTGVSFKYPSTWVSVGNEEQPMFLNSDGTGSSVNLVTEKLPSGIDFERYINISKVNIKAQMDVSGEIEQEEIALNGAVAYKLSYEAETEGVSLKLVQIAINVADTVHILTVGSRAEDYAAISDVLENIISSFK